jgi:hypothetical protein
MRALKWVGGVLLGVVLALALTVGTLLVIAPFSDGPIAVIPGGPLEAGELIEEPVTDWSFATAVDTIEMQLVADDDRSRTTWILVHEGAAFIPCTLGFPPGKAWHLLAVEDGRAFVRVEGKRYPVSLVRVEDAALQAELAAVSSAKYPPAPGSDEGSWYFALRHRAE